MRFPDFRHPLVVLTGILALLLATPLFSNAEEARLVSINDEFDFLH